MEKDKWVKRNKGTVLAVPNHHCEISVHHYVGCGDAWFVTCRPLDILCRSLNATDLESAQKEALEFAASIASMKATLMNDLSGAIREYC